MHGLVIINKLPSILLITASSETVDGQDYFLGGAVGMLTRSIVIEGQVNAGEAHGGRIIASVTQVDGKGRTGTVSAFQNNFYIKVKKWVGFLFLALLSVRLAIRPSRRLSMSLHLMKHIADFKIT